MLVAKVWQELKQSLALTKLNWQRDRLGLVGDGDGIVKACEAISQYEVGQRELEVDDRPVFLLAAGWRSGSTWLQRMLVASEQILIWGEPYAHAHLIQNLAEAARAFTAPKWPKERWFIDRQNLDALEQAWIANLYPPVEAYQEAQRQFLRELFAKPASVRGYDRWGLKEVRLQSEHALYLKWLFPQAKFIFLIRNPYDAYRSYCQKGNWYFRWPDRQVCTPQEFGEVWRVLAEGFLRDRDRVGALVLRYEDLHGDRLDRESLSNYLELNLPVLDSLPRLGGSSSKKEPQVPKGEIRALARAVAPLAKELGYYPTS